MDFMPRPVTWMRGVVWVFCCGVRVWVGVDKVADAATAGGRPILRTCVSGVHEAGVWCVLRYTGPRARLPIALYVLFATGDSPGYSPRAVAVPVPDTRLTASLIGGGIIAGTGQTVDVGCAKSRRASQLQWLPSCTLTAVLEHVNVRWAAGCVWVRSVGPVGVWVTPRAGLRRSARNRRAHTWPAAGRAG